MSSGPSLYRRHRPRSFADVVGQEHVVRTLGNAVEQAKVHHAYLFVGSRGTGKTSMAKILAACLNCERGPTTQPCGVCDSCVAIANATSLDVIEMDAASNNSVDDIRDLRERVAYAPVSGKHKVYILDEAHMLSSQAWNAFLKTLEEPPPHTIFVLATTEANKVLPTVVDRCHRFDFGRPTMEQLATVVRRVADAEDIEIPPDAVALLARHATGSFRDALGTLEQLVTYSGPTIALPDVLAVLGVADADLLFEALDAVGAHDARAALLAVARLADSGRDLSQFARDLEAHAREILVVQTLGEVPAELSLTPDRDGRLAEQAARVQRGAAVRLLDLLAVGMKAVRDGADARTQLELALVKAATPEVDGSTRALLARIERLEGTLSGRTPAAHAAPPASPASAQPVSSAAPPAPVAAPPTPVAAAPVAPPAPSDPAASAASTPAPSAPGAPPAFAAAAPASRAATPAGVVAVAEPPPAAAPAPAFDPSQVSLDSVLAVWDAVLDALPADKPLIATSLNDGRPVAVESGELVIAFAAQDTFKRRIVDNTENRVTLTEALRQVTGAPLRVRTELREHVAPPTEQAAVQPPSEEELVARFVAEFDAEEIVPDEEPQPGEDQA